MRHPKSKATPSGFLCAACSLLLVKRGGILNPEKDMCDACQQMLQEAHEKVELLNV
jgi:hypothetical protein